MDELAGIVDGRGFRGREHMTLFPVIHRELRAQARQPFTYWLRLLGAGAALAVMAVMILNGGSGGESFAALHRMVLLSIWVLVPLGVADCVSRERREGTLGLLFLTPLRARDVALAKAGTHGLRGLALLLAVLPMMAVTFLQGGVGWRAVVFSFSINLAWLALVVAVSVLASAHCRSWTRALALTHVLIVVSAVAAGTLKMFAAILVFRPSAIWQVMEQLDSFIAGSVQYLTGGRGLWSTNFTASMIPPGVIRRIMLGELVTTGALLAMALTLVLWAGHVIARRWREEPPPVWMQKTSVALTKPRFGVAFFRRWMLRHLEKNPIGWLERRTWSGRVVVWAWFAVTTTLCSAAVTDQNIWRDPRRSLLPLVWLLPGSMGYLAAGSFRRERENGVMELLLVSPLTPQQIILGRLRGIWGQFLPAAALLVFVWLAVRNLGLYQTTGAEWLGFFLVAFGAVPVIGLSFSLSSRTTIGAFVLTALFGFALPPLLGWLVVVALDPFTSWNMRERDSAQLAFSVIALALLAGAFGQGMRWRLERRKFQFNTGVS